VVASLLWDKRGGEGLIARETELLDRNAACALEQVPSPASKYCRISFAIAVVVAGGRIVGWCMVTPRRVAVRTGCQSGETTAFALPFP
jgi:hypothetical protein